MVLMKIIPARFSRNSKLQRVTDSLKRSMSTTNVDDEVILQSVADKGIITLNRPKALNALNLSMIKKIYPVLKSWELEKRLVIIKGAGEKAFCAGGDVRAITESGLKGENLGKEFFRSEYSLNALIGTYHIPYVAFIDGITMGGGVGLSVHGHHRVATERTLFAMPETAIGLFPDVGGTYFLPRLGGKLGLFLALTGHRLKGTDVYKAGIATHFCESSKLADLEKELINCPTPESMVADILNTFSKESLPEKVEFSLAPYMERIDSCFSAKTVEQIFKNLENDGTEWATKTLETLSKMSPTSLKITKVAIEEGASKDLQECLAMEYRLAVHACEGHDFFEGVKIHVFIGERETGDSVVGNMKRSLDVVRNSFKLSLLRRYATTNETGVTFQSAGDKGIITLNRPKVLNALNLPLLKEVYAILKCWETEKSLVIAKGAGGKAFSAGGDIKSIAEGIKKDKNFRKEFFQAEYSVMAQIGLYKIPYVSLMDGIAMGAGAAIGLNGCYSVASERTLFSLPETAIGLFPDVGNSYLLPRLEGKLGLYLALTGTRLNGIDVYKAGITTHFCESHKMADLENQLICCTNQASDALKILDKFCEESVPKDAKFSLSSQKEKINSYFCAQSVEDILEKLRCDCSEWSTKTLETLCKMSPTGLKIAKAAIEEGACKKDLQECLRMEYRLIYRLSERHDFFEGVKALLIDKGRKAEWKPQTLQEVSDSFIRKQFAPLAPEEELRL